MRLVMNVDPMYYTDLSWEETATMVNQSGFTGTDFGLFEMKDIQSRWYEPDWQDKANQLLKTFASAGTPIVQTHAPFSFPDIKTVDTYLEQVKPLVIHSIEVSAALGAGYVIVHPIHCIPYKTNVEELFRINMDYYRDLIPVAKSNGIRIAMENMFQRDKLRGRRIIHSTCSSIAEFCRYLDTLDSEYVVGCLDIGHTVLPMDNPEPWEFIRQLGPERIKTLHVHDNDLLDDRHLIPFSGQIDWYEVTKALGQINYSGDFVLECILKSNTAKLKPAMYPALLAYMGKIGHHLIDNVEANRPE